MVYSYVYPFWFWILCKFRIGRCFMFVLVFWFPFLLICFWWLFCFCLNYYIVQIMTNLEKLNLTDFLKNDITFGIFNTSFGCRRYTRYQIVDLTTWRMKSGMEWSPATSLSLVLWAFLALQLHNHRRWLPRWQVAWGWNSPQAQCCEFESRLRLVVLVN